MKLIETCFLTSVIILTNVRHWMGVPSISQLMVVSEVSI